MNDKQQEIERIRKRIDELSEIYCETWEEREHHEERGNLEAYHSAQGTLHSLNVHIEELENQLIELGASK